MDFLGLNPTFLPVKTLRCINAQWNRRYYEAGDFSIQLRASDWDANIAYIYTRERPETGMVQKVETEHTVKGDFVLVSGYFLEGMLNWKVVYPRRQGIGNLSAHCRALVAAFLTDVGVTVPSGAALGSDVTFDLQGASLGDATYGMLKLQELGQRIRLDYETGALCYEVWQGENRAQSGAGTCYAAFCQGFGNVDTLTLTQDDSGYRNYAVAVYQSDVLLVDIRTDMAEPIRALYLNTGLSIVNGQTQADFLASVRTAAKTELAKHVRVVNIDADVLQNHLFYLTDYDLGDRCDVRDDRLKLAFEARIIEVNEVWKENRHLVSLQFGSKLPVAYHT
jgi:hypothetical protein